MTALRLMKKNFCLEQVENLNMLELGMKEIEGIKDPKKSLIPSISFIPNSIKY
jgi:hypothetical protein